MDENQAAARQFIVESCLRLSLGEEQRFTRSVVALAFPAEPIGRTSEDQILDETECRSRAGGSVVLPRFDRTID